MLFGNRGTKYYKIHVFCIKNNNRIYRNFIFVQHIKLQSSPFITKVGDTLVSSVDVSYPKLSGGNEIAIAKINAFVAKRPIKDIFFIGGF